MEPKPPLAITLSPSEGSVFARGSLVILEGAATDREDDPRSEDPGSCGPPISTGS